MAETLISPGVLTRENDQSFIQGQPVEVGAAIIGPAIKGPVEKPTIVSSYSDYLNKFGSTFVSGGAEYSYFTSISAYNYFQQGGNSLLVTRVVTGSFTSATALVSGSGAGGAHTSSFTLETISEGEIMNNSGSFVGTGSLISGSIDNVRYEIQGSNTSSGTFSLLIRRGDDSQNSKVVLETFNNLSLDPTSPNFITRQIGDQTFTITNDADGNYYEQISGSFANRSSYVRVKSVNFPTPNYLNNAGQPKSQFVGAIPPNGSGSAGGSFASATGTLYIETGAAPAFYENITNGTNIQGLNKTSYNNAINLLANADAYRYNVISAPGLIYGASGANTQVVNMVNNTIVRGDAIAVIDTGFYNAEITTVIDNAANFDNSYSATYYPWLQTVDPDTANVVWVPASAMIPSVYAFTDASSDPWFAPAGLNRGALPTVVRPARRLSSGNRDDLYTGNVNPIATFPNTGNVVFGQKTLQKRPSALDRVNVRRLLITLKDFISQVADRLVFEQNTAATRNNFLNQVNPYLSTVQQQQGLYAYKVVMDDSNNTPDVIDRNELIGQIFIQPTRTAEFIILDFNVLPTGATFPS